MHRAKKVRTRNPIDQYLLGVHVISRAKQLDYYYGMIHRFRTY